MPVEKPSAIARRLSPAAGRGAPPGDEPVADNPFVEPAPLPRKPPGPGPLPPAASPYEIEQRRQRLRETQHVLASTTTMLDARRAALPKATDEKWAAQAALAEAEDALRHATQFGRRDLALAYLEGREVSDQSPTQAAAERQVRATVAAHCAEVAAGLEEAIAESEYQCREAARERDEALRELVTARRRAGQVIAGFGAETGDVLANGRVKLARKGCDLLVVNRVGDGLAFGTADNEAVVYGADGTVTKIPRGPKEALAGVAIALSSRLTTSTRAHC